MKQKDLLKKYWFILATAICAIFFLAYYAVQDAKSKQTKIKTVQKDGQYLIYQTGESFMTADKLYDSLYTNYAAAAAFSKLNRLTLNSLYETSSEMKDIASSNAQYILSKHSETDIKKEMLKAGYDGIKGLSDYYIDLQKNNLFARDFFNAHRADIVEPFVKENNSKLISHILIKVADMEEGKDKDGNKIYTAKPTEAEQNKLNEVLEALKTDSFANVAKKYSEDTSAKNGGSLGYYDKKIAKRYVPEFAEEANLLQEGAVSEVTTTKYGWHIIRCDAANIDSLLKEDDFINQLRSSNGLTLAKAIYDKAKEIGINVENEDLKKKIEAIFTESKEQETK